MGELSLFARRIEWPSGGMADAGDLKSPVRNGRVGSTPTSASQNNIELQMTQAQ